MGKLEIDQEPGVFVSGARARWLLQARRAQLTPAGKLRILFGRAHALPGAGSGKTDIGPHPYRTIWTAYSSSGAANHSGKRWLGGFHMNGDMVNHG